MRRAPMRQLKGRFSFRFATGRVEGIRTMDRSGASWWRSAVRAMVVGLAALAVGPASAGPLEPGQTADPAITAQQIEADWLRQEQLRGPLATGLRAAPAVVAPEDDAAGAVDGVIDGAWGFHTENEANPWWQVDLGEPVAIEAVVLYNRCDDCAPRAARVEVLLSDDADRFERAYQHDGSVFFGKKDDQPLRVALGGRKARFVRLQLPGTSYFHLDEVQVFAADESGKPPRNVALGRPATQSSVSQWSVRHERPGRGPITRASLTAVVERGRKLADALERLGVDTSADRRTLEEFSRRAEQFDAVAEDTAAEGAAAAERLERLYFDARWTVRRLALRNPLLAFDRLLLVERKPPAFPHMSDQYYGWWARGGGGLYVLERFKGERPTRRCVSEGFPQGSFLRPDVSYDGRRVLFAFARSYPELYPALKVDKSKLPEDVFYKLYELDLETGALRRLTHGKYDDFDGRYLPDGDIVFLSTRKGQALRATCDYTERTLRADLPDSYVRCGGDDRRPVPVFTLHRMGADGQRLRPISAFENFEWNPAVGADGRILYARWDYIDRFNGPFMSLWSTNPDGTNPQLVYGNFTVRPQCVFEARSVPGSRKIVFTAAAHHSNEGGSIVLLDRARGIEFDRPLQRVTPEVCFPETEGWPNHYYANPWPLSEEFFLVAWADRPLPPHTFVDDPARNPVNASGIYLLDVFGNLELLYRNPDISSMYPMPIAPRPRPPIVADTLPPENPLEGRFLVQDVYRGMESLPRGTVRRLRIVAVPPKVQPQMNTPNLGVSAEDPGKYVLGTAPVEADGSAYFRVPSGVPVFFQAIDQRGMAVRTMRTLTYVQPGQTLACIGCHEHRDLAPPGGSPPLAALSEPSRITPGPEGSWPLDYGALVQPVLDAHCVACHHAGAPDAKAAAFDLSAGRSYDNLLNYADKDLHKLVVERDRSAVGDGAARQSRLLNLVLDGKHEGVRLDLQSVDRLVTWMDVYAQRQGHFSDEQAAALEQARRDWAELLETTSSGARQAERR